MKQIFRVEKVNIINDNLEFSAVKTRIVFFNKVVFSFSKSKKTEFKNNLKYI